MERIVREYIEIGDMVHDRTSAITHTLEVKSLFSSHSVYSAYSSCLATMETCQPLSIESFSYRWLVNIKPSYESLDDTLLACIDTFEEASFIEMDPKLPPSKRFFSGSQDCNFDFPASQSPLSLVHADELISNGFLVPLFVKPSKMEEYDASSSTPLQPISSHAQKSVHSANKFRCSSLRRCRRLSRRLFWKYLDFLRPLCQRLGGRRSGSGADTLGTKMQELKHWIYSPATPPRPSVAYSADNCRRSCDDESSIYEAVLHCKRSIGK
ncbi:probable membrane-associated kinase regulator 6 [Cornus florida]|uniref:probable membrane-associated kinase regulator 6 n=1 Tax=Cornus florida TaxID=4283 RepID=UPI00289DE62B|nr:probable membrane-associated kinase regulator 6 [Cornus florida]